MLNKTVETALAAYHAGDYAKAFALAAAEAAAAPKNALASQIAGTALHKLGRDGDALGFLEAAAAIDPANGENHNTLGVVLERLQRFAEAASSFSRAVALKPDFGPAHFALGRVLMALSQPREAEASFRRVLESSPDAAEVRFALGNSLYQQARWRDAAECYRECLRKNAADPVAANNLAMCLQMQGMLSEAETAYRRSLAIAPDNLGTVTNLGSCLKEQGKLEEAEACYRQVLEADPRRSQAFSNLLFLLNYSADRPAAEIFDEYRAFDRRFCVPLRAAWRAHANPPAAGRKLKIGYVSPDFRRHSARHFIEPLLSRHDKEAFEIYAYAELLSEDETTLRYRSHVDHWVPTRALSDDAMAARIRADGIDILVDLAGHTSGSRLSVFAHKPAPVSLSWLGYGYTTGLSAIDYFLTDPVNTPVGADAFFSEKPWRIETPSYVYRAPDDMGPVGDLPAARRGFVTFGTLSRAVRLNRHCVRVWSQLLRSVPNSRLAINSYSFFDPQMREAFAQKFVACGIARDRLEIGCNTPPWEVLRGIDIGLDCFPHNSGVTLFETLYMGVPTVTLAGRPSVGLIGSSILHGVGHPEWIAADESAYLQIAGDLAGDLARLADLRRNLRAEMRSRSIMDEPLFARKVEDAYRQMFADWEKRR